MRFARTAFLFLFLSFLSFSIFTSLGRCSSFPVPTTVSKKMQSLIAANPPDFWNLHPKNLQEWKDFSDGFYKSVSATLPKLIKKFNVSIESGDMAGVPVFTITPHKKFSDKNDFILLHLHGGGYVLGKGKSGIPEGIMMSGFGGFKVLSVDYRMAPEYPYPAALDDAVTVYKELLKKYSSKKIGVFGTSTGGGMTLALVLRLKKEKLPLPGAIAPGTPWSDLSCTGDSYYTNEHIDNVLVSYDGWLGEAAKVYADGHNLKDPMLSPVYGNVEGFPPTLLTSGTRDLFLSNTVRMQKKLLEAGVDVRLIVFEGLSHAQYYLLPDSPETAFHFRQLKLFFIKNLHL
ncbi:alpha/beta hydrolase [Maridesulfovibrio bastinii]|uniref:alpha/beta hydrolase n=1 Tax=Maridesulfovibrio bastinii TaxID=47157 RepID=UPI000685E200|nr:alpha/beta hydrolase [Maridesulfovibrio bastinii]